MSHAGASAAGAALLWALAAASVAQTPAAPTPADPAMPGVLPVPGCVPPGLFRAVIRDISPGVAAADPRAQPRTLYRQGALYLRSEEPPNPARPGQIVIAVSEPDLWELDLATRTGRHSVDPGPEFEVHVPILPPLRDLPGPFRQLEYGCEAAFVAAYAPAEQRVVPWGSARAGLHGVTLGDHSVAILMDQKRNTPLLVSYLRQGKPVLVMRYDDYRVGQKERPDLFMPPKGFMIQEAPRRPPPAPPPAQPPKPLN